jgi:pimeloyl-ACP methyl ester carboxylesterase
MKQISSKLTCLVLTVLMTFLFDGTTAADDYIVLDGLGGIRQQWMQDEVTRLRCEGHCVDYRPWWRWRSAARAATGPVNVIGYSLGGSRASWAARRLQVSGLELVDPVRIVGSISVPPAVPTTVYRATQSNVIISSPVQGCYQEYFFPTDHLGMPQYFRQ